MKQVRKSQTRIRTYGNWTQFEAAVGTSEVRTYGSFLQRQVMNMNPLPSYPFFLLESFFCLYNKLISSSLYTLCFLIIFEFLYICFNIMHYDPCLSSQAPCILLFLALAYLPDFICSSSYLLQNIQCYWPNYPSFCRAFKAQSPFRHPG